MDVVWEPIPDDLGIPPTEGFSLVRVYSERPEFSGDGGLDFVVAMGFEGFVHARVDLLV